MCHFQSCRRKRRVKQTLSIHILMEKTWKNKSKKSMVNRKHKKYDNKKSIRKLFYPYNGMQKFNGASYIKRILM